METLFLSIAFVISAIIIRTINSVVYIVTYPFNYKRIRAEREEEAARRAAIRAIRQAEIEERSKEYRLIGEPADGMTVKLFSLPMSFFDAGEYPEYMYRFFQEHGIYRSYSNNRPFDADTEWRIAKILHDHGGAFVVPLDDQKFATGLEVWFKDKEHSDAFVQKYMWYPEDIIHRYYMNECLEGIPASEYEIPESSSTFWFKTESARDQFRRNLSQYVAKIVGTQKECEVCVQWCKDNLEAGTWNHYFSRQVEHINGQKIKTVTFYFNKPVDNTMFTMIHVR